MAINTADILAKLREAVSAAPSLTAWAHGHGHKHQNISAVLRGLVGPSETMANALGYRRVTLQAYLKPGEALPLMPPGWEQVTPGGGLPIDWKPTPAPPLDQEGRTARARAAGLIGGPAKAAAMKAREKGVDTNAA